MRDIDANLAAHLEGGATTLARAWVVTRRDGVVMGFTDHDKPLMVGATACAPGSGMDASAVERSTGLSVDNSQAMGALSSAGITDLDVETGKFDGAEVELWMVNWCNPDQRLLQFRGTLGEIRRSDGAFEAELRGLAENLNRPVGRIYMRQCDRVLGDQKCGFDINAEGFVTEAIVDFFEGRKVVELKNVFDFEDGWFVDGFVSWLGGANEGRDGLVRVDRLDGVKRIVELWEETRFPIAVGDRMRLHAGCDKRMTTCAAKFDNLLNFRGFPHMPGEDWSVVYPVPGSEMDGGSLSG